MLTRHHTIHTTLLRAAFIVTVAATLLPPLSRAADESGGTGTIDPNTVSFSEVLRDGAGIKDTDDFIQARYFASDATGNFYVGTMSTHYRDVAYTVTHSTISSYTATGILRWRRERAVDLDSQTETFSPD